MDIRNALFVLLCLSFISCPKIVSADEMVARNIPDRYGIGMTCGNTYAPGNDISFALMTGFVLFDYEKIWGHKAPQDLRFKVEGNLGGAVRPDKRLMTSANIFALYYLGSLYSAIIRPYIEGGIGFIYTDFQVEGQGLRFNFNPQAGIGAEFAVNPGFTMFAAFRLHHISNAGLNHDNRGINSVTFTLGRLF